MELPYLPQDIVEEEILSRLQVKPLLRFRCVSKSWCSLISSNKFAKKHLQKSKANTDFSDQALISAYMKSKYKGGYGSDKFSVIEPIDELFSDGEEFCMRDEWNEFEIVGYSNGLCCVHINKYQIGEFILWNPCTRKSYQIPLLYPVNINPYDVFIDSYGFGFDEVNDDYKIFTVLSERVANGIVNTMVKVFSLKSNSWKIITGFDECRLLSNDPGKLVAGKLHWVPLCQTFPKWKIFTFDLSSEMNGVLEGPTTVDKSLHPFMEVLNGCLCVRCFCQDKCCIDVWILKEYGVKESWCKIFRVPYEKGPHNDGVTSITIGITEVARQVIPMCITPSLEILCYNKLTFKFYNPKTNSHRDPQLSDVSKVEIRRQSLVSPEPEEQNQPSN